VALGQVQRVHPVGQRARRAAAQGLQRVVHGHGLAVLHEDARLTGGARTLPHHEAAQPGLGDALRVGREGPQLVNPQARIGHPVVETLHELPTRDHRPLLQRHPGRAARGQQLLVQARTAQRRIHQLLQAHLLALRDAQGSTPLGGHDVQRHGGQAQQIEHGAHGGRSLRYIGRSEHHRSTRLPQGINTRWVLGYCTPQSPMISSLFGLQANTIKRNKLCF